MAHEVEKVDVLPDSPEHDLSEEAPPIALESPHQTSQAQGAGRDDLEETESAEGNAELEEETALVPTDSLSRYMAELRRYPLLSPEEEHELAVQYKEYGDVQAAYRLVTANLRLVVMIARSLAVTSQRVAQRDTPTRPLR